MNVLIRESGEVKQLGIVDDKTGIDWVADLIGNAGAMVNKEFIWLEWANAYHAYQVIYDWWAQYIADFESTGQEAEALAEELDLPVEDILYRIDAEAGSDYGDHRKHAIRTMQEIRKEHTIEIELP